MSPWTPTSRPAREALLVAVAAAAGLAGALAPATLTGSRWVDVAERALLAAFVTFVGAHGRRWGWIVAAGLLVLPARGTSLVLALVGLAILVVASAQRSRPKLLGAVGLAFVVNAPFWYRSDAHAVAPVVALAAFGILLVAGNRHQRRARRRTTSWVLAGLGGLVVLGGLLLGVAVLRASGQVSDGAASARQALQAARNGDGDAARVQLAQASGHFAHARGAVTGVLSLPVRVVPILAQQHRAISVAVEEGGRVSQAGDDLVSTADYDRLRYQGRIDLQQVQDLAGPTERANVVLHEATDHLQSASDAWLLPPLEDRLDELADELADAGEATDLASALFEVTPDLLGGDGSRRYLVLFLTPAELRGGGGFIGSYAELTATSGHVRLTRSGPIRDLIDGAPTGTRRIEGHPDYLARYGSFQPQDYLQDATYSPDFPTDASVMAQLYSQSGGAEVDGVIGVDPAGLAALLALTGPVQVPGLADPLTTSNAEEVLLRGQYVDVPDEAARDEVLAEATRLTFEALTGGSLPGPKQLADTLSPAARSGHLRLWSPVPAEQALFERLGADGALRIPRGDDGFSVVQQNLGNNKLDAYLHRTIAYDATVDAATGALEATLTIRLRNDAPDLGLPDAVVGNSRGVPRGTNMASLSVFTPNFVTSASVDGLPVTLAPSTELGLNAWDVPALLIGPGDTVEVVLELTGGIDLRNGYRLRILPQPVANPDRFTATLEVTGGRAGDRDAGDRSRLVGDLPLERPTSRRIRIVR